MYHDCAHQPVNDTVCAFEGQEQQSANLAVCVQLGGEGYLDQRGPIEHKFDFGNELRSGAECKECRKRHTAPVGTDHIIETLPASPHPRNAWRKALCNERMGEGGIDLGGINLAANRQNTRAADLPPVAFKRGDGLRPVGRQSAVRWKLGHDVSPKIPFDF